MGRSTKKGPYVDEKLLKKVQQLAKNGEKKVIKTWARRSMVAPDFVGHTFAVHNGHRFINVFVTEEMVGHRLGEMAPTRFFKGHGAAHTKEATALT
jgi:small subunit ribosomal protein S19